MLINCFMLRSRRGHSPVSLRISGRMLCYKLVLILVKMEYFMFKIVKYIYIYLWLVSIGEILFVKH